MKARSLPPQVSGTMVIANLKNNLYVVSQILAPDVSISYSVIDKVELDTQTNKAGYLRLSINKSLCNSRTPGASMSKIGAFSIKHDPSQLGKTFSSNL